MAPNTFRDSNSGECNIYQGKSHQDRLKEQQQALQQQDKKAQHLRDDITGRSWNMSTPGGSAWNLTSNTGFTYRGSNGTFYHSSDGGATWQFFYGETGAVSTSTSTISSSRSTSPNSSQGGSPVNYDR